MATKRVKRRLSIPGMIIIAVAFIAVVFSLVMLMKYFFLDRNKTEYKDKNKEDIVVKEDIIENVEIDYGIDLIDYKYYISNETDFNFVVAEFDFKNNSIKYELDDFVTDENINLGNVEDYLTKLNSLGIYPNIEGIITKIPEKSGAFACKLFIPVKNEKKLEVVYKEQKFEIDLSKNITDIATLNYKQEEEISDDETFSLKITGVQNLTGIYLTRNGDQYEPGSQVQLYGLICDVDCLSSDPFIMESAYFEDSNGYVYFALDKDIKAYDVDNLVGLKILKSSTGAVLFELINPSDEQNTLYYGKLHIKLNNDVNEYIINVSLN